MTPEQIRLVRSTYSQVDAIADQAADLFYDRLFTIAPGVKPLFKNDMRTQGRMLMSSIGLVVRNLDHPEKILPMVEKMGQRHNAYGAKPEHYPVVGEALLWTLEQGLGNAFTPEVKDAWAAAYGLLSQLMIDAQLGGAKAKVA